MNKILIPFTVIFIVILLSTTILTTGTMSETAANKTSIYDFTVSSIDGNPTPLSAFSGKVVIVVNVASKCGLTPQYAGLQKLYDQYGDKGLVILGFPANNFNGQEPGTDKEIKLFCSLNYDVKFPMFSKISVKGNDIHELYTFLTSKETNPEFSGDIAWNFTKFLFDRNGKIINRFEPKIEPLSEDVTSAIEKVL